MRWMGQRGWRIPRAAVERRGSRADLPERSGARSLILSLLVAVLACSLFSCGLGVRTRALFGGKLEVAVKVSEKANKDNPVAVDLLLVHDEALYKELLKLSAKEWFEKRDQYHRDYAHEGGFDAWSWEWVPGQTVSDQRLPLQASAVGAIVYAKYLTPGAHRAPIDPHTSVKLHLGETDFTVSSPR